MKITFLMTALGSLAFLAPRLAHAANQNYTQGNMCSSSNDDATFQSNGFKNNATGTTNALWCPIINTDRPTANFNGVGRVRGFDNDNQGFLFECNGSLRDTSGNITVIVGDAT